MIFEKLGHILDSFDGTRVLVVGDVMLESYLSGPARPISAEAPIPVIDVTSRLDVPGGAANTAINVAALGGKPTLLSVVGDDADGVALRWQLELQGVSTEHLRAQGQRRTVSRRRVMADGQLIARLDEGTTSGVDEITEVSLADRLAELLPRHQVTIVTDYGWGVMTAHVIARLRALARASHPLLLLDARNLLPYRGVPATLMKTNYEQSMFLLGRQAASPRTDRPEVIGVEGEAILAAVGTGMAVVTLDADGALLLKRGQLPYRIYTRFRPMAAARETFIAAMGLALTAREDPRVALQLAALAESCAGATETGVVCSPDELGDYLAAQLKHVWSDGQLVELVDAHRKAGRRIVFTNGCFDVLHSGHVGLLSGGRELGDVLMVAVNTDESVERLKGGGRPVNTIEDRLQVLAALSSVSHVVPFAEDTPHRLISLVRPDLFVKGGDYRREDLSEAPLVEELGGTVHILPYVEDRSTTRIIRHLHDLDVA